MGFDVIKYNDMQYFKQKDRITQKQVSMRKALVTSDHKWFNWVVK